MKIMETNNFLRSLEAFAISIAMAGITKGFDVAGKYMVGQLGTNVVMVGTSAISSVDSARTALAKKLL